MSWEQRGKEEFWHTVEEGTPDELARLLTALEDRASWEQRDKEELINNGALVIDNLEGTLTSILGDKYQWEWRSVVGECVEGNPIWSLTLYVEPKEEE